MAEWKKWAGRAGLVVIPSLFLLVSLEIACRGLGWGYPTSFLVPDRVGGRDVWRTNEFYGYRFFQPLMARSPAPAVIDRTKAPGVKRVAVLGESAAMGDPLIEFGLARALDKILNNPGEPQRYEVVNAAMTAISSPVIVDIASELARQDFDVFVVYMGNNEVVGPYGPDTVFRGGGAARWFAPLHVWWTRSRFASAVNAWKSSASPGRPWDGMTMFSQNRVTASELRAESFYEQYEANLERIVSAAKRNGIETIFCTMAVNLRDCPPFGSAHGHVLEEEEAEEWQASFDVGKASIEAGRHTEGVQAFAEALRIDPNHAEANYLAAVAAEKSGATDDAAQLYRRARDFDTLRVRTDSRMNELIRAVAARSGTKLIESDEIFGSAPGAESFIDHVHFTIEGVGLLANAIAAAIEENPPVLDTNALAQRLDYNAWSKSKLATIMLQRLEHSPFRDQAGNAGRVASWQTARQSVDAKLSAADADQILADLQKSQADYPWDDEYAIQSLHRLAGIGAWPRAAKLADSIRPQLRGASAASGLLALVYAKAGSPEAAAEVLVAAGPPHGFFLIDATFQLLAVLTEMGDSSAASKVAEHILRTALVFPGRPALLKWSEDTGH